MTYDELIKSHGASYYWRLGETSGTVAVDSVGGANGTISGGVTLNQAGALADGSKAMLFDGVSGRINTTAVVSLIAPCSIEIWSKYSSVSAVSGLVGNLHNNSTEAIWLYLNPGGAIQAQIFTQSNQYVSCGVGSYDVWHHSVVVISPTMITSYLDGSPVGSVVLSPTYTGTIQTFDFGAAVWLGNPTNFFNGSIDEVAIYPYALTPAQIQQHYAARLTTAPVAPPPEVNYPEVILADQPSYYWQLNEASGTTAIESVGGANGTISGGVTLAQPGIAGKSMLFDGVNSQIVTGGSYIIPRIFTFETWFKGNDTGTLRGLLSQLANSPLITFNGGGLFFYDNANSLSGVGSWVMPIDTLWHHLVCVLDGSTFVVYLDGIFFGTQAAARPNPTPSSIIGIGYSIANATFWKGSIDEVAIYPYALSPAQISSHYLARFGISDPNSYAGKVIASGPSNYWRLGELSGTTAVDLVGGANGTISGGVVLNGEAGMTFNGTTGKITTSSTIPVTATTEAWIKFSSNVGQAPFLANFSGGGGGVYIGVNTNKACCFALSSTPGTTPLNDDKWHHIVYVFTNPGCLCYVDGVLERNNPGETRSIVTLSASIGWDVSQAAFWPGSIDEVAIYPRALSAAEISEHYSARSYVEAEPDEPQIYSIPAGPSVLMKQSRVYAMPGVKVQIMSDAILQVALDPSGPWMDLADKVAEVGHPFIRCATQNALITAHKSAPKRRGRK